MKIKMQIEGIETDNNVVILPVESEESIASVSEMNKVADLPVLEVTAQQEKSEDNDDMWIAPV